jgi:predicted amidohydrolase
MDELRVACGQFEARLGDKAFNLDVMASQARAAHAAECQVVVFAELSVSGYLQAERVAEVAEPVDGPSVRELAGCARELGIQIVFGMAERAGDRLYNSMVALDARGEVAACYRKLHLFGAEERWATAGSEVVAFTLAGVPATGWICFDTRFPELARSAAAAGAEVACVPTAWLGPPAEWELAVRSRAMDNTLFVAGADQICHAEGLRCRGNSIIAGPHGDVLARAVTDTDGVIWADLHSSELEEQRARLALLENRRSDLFGPGAAKTLD